MPNEFEFIAAEQSPEGRDEPPISGDDWKKPKKITYEQYAENFLVDAAKKKSFFKFHKNQRLRYKGNCYTFEQELAILVRRYMKKNGFSQSNNIIGNILPIIDMMVHAPQDAYPDLPFWFGDFRAEGTGEQICVPKDIIAFRNGLVNIKDVMNGKQIIMPHTQNFVSMCCLPHDYDPAATCQPWLDFLNWAFDADPERIALLQEFFGYCMTPDNRFQKMLCLHGPSRSGKGTIVRVLEQILSKDNMTGYALESLADAKFGKCSLVGKLVATIGEVNLQMNPHKYTIYQHLNMIVGDDAVEIEWKHNPIKSSVHLYCRFIMACNKMPNFHDDSQALAERLLILNFLNALPEDKRDINLTNKLGQDASGITNWALVGLHRLLTNNRFTEPETMKKALVDFRRNASKALAFVQDRLIVSRSLDTGNLSGVEISDELCDDPGMRVFCEELKKHYEKWCVDNDISDINVLHLYQNIRTLIPKLEVKSKTDMMGTLKRCYPGLKLKPTGGLVNTDEILTPD